MRISMDGRARCLYNVCIKRFRRTIKHEYVYINPESTVGELLRGISKYLDYYNNRRCHQGLAHQTPPPCGIRCGLMKLLEVKRRIITLAHGRSVLDAEIYVRKALQRTKN